MRQNEIDMRNDIIDLFASVCERPSTPRHKRGGKKESLLDRERLIYRNSKWKKR